jgi:uncharacterized protein YndB with AHSA1/START domain
MIHDNTHERVDGLGENTSVMGSLRSEGGTGTVRMEDRYDTGIDDLWSALTNPERLARWIADVDGDLSVGGRVQVRFTSGWDGPGRVDVCEAPHRLLMTMSPGRPDETVIEAVLSADGDRTRLVIEERLLPLAGVAGHGAGWQAHVEDLAAHLAGHERADWTERWTQLTPAYQALASQLA